MAETRRSSTRRKSRFVHMGIQGALVARLIAQFVAFATLMSLMSLWMHFAFNPLQNAEQWQQQVNITLASSLLVAVCLLPIFIRDSLKFSHRFTGPILRLHNQVRKVGLEHAEPIKLRSEDFWQDLAVDFNQMMERCQLGDLGELADRPASRGLQVVGGVENEPAAKHLA